MINAWQTVNGNEMLDSRFLWQCNISHKHCPAMTQQRVTPTYNIAHTVTRLILYHKSTPKQVTK